MAKKPDEPQHPPHPTPPQEQQTPEVPREAPLVLPPGGASPDFREAKGVKLDSPDKNQMPTAPEAGEGAVPRVINQNERAPEGLKRYKITTVNYHPANPRYVLAHSADEARDFYYEKSGLSAQLGALKQRGAQHEPAVLSVKELAD